MLREIRGMGNNVRGSGGRARRGAAGEGGEGGRTAVVRVLGAGRKGCGDGGESG